MEKIESENEICSQSGISVEQQHENDMGRNLDKSGVNKSGSISRQTMMKLYVSRALSALGARFKAFCLGVFINKLASENLRIVAIYGFVVNVSAIIFGASVGRWIDQNKRLFAAKVCLLAENVSVTLAYLVLVLYYTFWMENEVSKWIVIGSVILISILANLASLGCKITIEKDWIVVMTAGDETRLASMNAVFTTINLAALVLSPMFSGLLFHLANQEVVALAIGLWNIVSIFIEYYLMISIYNDHPELAMKKELEPVAIDGTKKSVDWISCRLDKPWNYIKDVGTGWKLYMTHNVRNAGLGLAFLWMTVLGFDNITYGFCLAQCVTDGVLGILVGVSAFIGILGSLSFPYIRKRFGLAKTGVIGMGCLITADMLCVISIWLDGSPFDPLNIENQAQEIEKINDNDLDRSPVVPTFSDTNNSTLSTSEDPSDCQISSFLSVSVLLSGILMAKFGLWIADITITQTIQEDVEEEHRGVINGVQNSMNSLMDTIKFSLVILLPAERTFGFLILASFVSIVCGAASYTNHALHSIKTKQKEKRSYEKCDTGCDVLT